MPTDGEGMMGRNTDGALMKPTKVHGKGLKKVEKLRARLEKVGCKLERRSRKAIEATERCDKTRTQWARLRVELSELEDKIQATV